jgi:peptidyl-prolyl cis-trans isomerase D
MAVLEKIRVKMGVFITAVIGLALLSFIIDADTLQSAVSLFSNKYDVGEMNGKAISYQDFQKRVEYFNNIHQLLTGSASVDEQTSDMINQNAWQDLLSENVILPSIEKAGIAVGEDEMFDLSQGSNVSQVLAREQIFMGQDGTFDRNMLVEFIKAIPTDGSGNLAAYWEYLEKNMYVDQMVGKYVNLLSKSSIQNPVELIRSIEDNNVTSEVSFVVQPFGFAEDTTITVTKQEVREFYNKNKHNFEQPASRDIEYVVFEVAPSLADIAAAENEIEGLMPEFKSSANLKNFLARNSDKPMDAYYYKKGELASESPVLDSFAFAAKPGDVLEPINENNVFKAARINDTKQLPDSVFVQHIMIQNPDAAVAKATIDSLMNLLQKGADFVQLAQENSVDNNPAAETAGDIGWMTQANTIPGFDTCFVLPVGKPVKLQSQFGSHIIRVKERTRPVPKVQLAVLQKAAIASKETFQDYYSKANDVASKSEGKIETFTQVTQEMNLYPMPAYNIAEGARSIANYPNAREIVRWAYEAEKGDVSQIISMDNKYFFIVALTEVREEGIPAVEKLEKDIATHLRREKANEKMVESVKEQIAGLTSLEEIAEKLGTTVSTQSGVSFGAPGSRSFDPKFVGAVTGAEVNKLTGPIAGNIGVYVFNVDSRETGAFFTEDDAKQRQQQSFSLQIQRLPAILEKMSEVKDNRAKFF